MLITLDPAATETLHEQLLGGLRGAIARGEVELGDRLPAARDLAGSLGVNVHTVLKAYGQLRDEGLIQMRRGRGAVVTAAPDAAGVADAVRHLLEAGRRAGLTLPDLHRALDEGAQA
ncbi:MAG: GntR family transcriptional regulator [Mobilicoccus sp.]|nr:GntR family transcriptional regulator [Mobilicoccus sp.]